MTIAKTAAAGGPVLHPEVLDFSSSLRSDLLLFREDLVGSLAHLTMLSRCQIIPREVAVALRAGLISLWEQGTSALPDEEDVHMAVEAALASSIGAPAKLLHTARSRNDQVSLDLRLHAREQLSSLMTAVAKLILELVTRAELPESYALLLPSYTHRQRAQPISLSYWLASYAAMLDRDLAALRFAYEQADALPLGAGAIAGTSLPIDRELTRALLCFERVTLNAMDTVGDRDFALDLNYAVARMLLHTSRLATDIIDFSTAEFGFAALDDDIACGSSMMPQKKNPDVFELVRGKSAKAVGNLVQLLVLVKGLPGGYNRDLQEDRGPFLEAAPLARGVLSILSLALPRVRFRAERCLNALQGDATQATDLAEALVRAKIPFREAYLAVGALVRRCQEQGVPMASATPELAQDLHPAFTEEVLRAVRIESSVAGKQSAGSTGPEPVRVQLITLRNNAEAALQHAESLPRLETLYQKLVQEVL